ncbi:MAG: Adenylyl cyclase CyaB [Parcubacteria group bacterium GW2011_GWB1_36_5]|nr:MAG: Adenylyl cyclase CyaB [Parcubacteria group bacterium GW2011_GWB1_36_5]
MYEVEVKAHLRNRENVIKKLKSFGCKFGKELHQIDTIFAPKGTPYPLLPLETPVLRVRKSNDKYFFTLKIPQTGHQDCIEREMEIKNGEMMIEIFKLMKWDNLPTVDKKRIKTRYKDMEIVLDKVKGLGEFIEVEKIVKHKDHEVRKNIQKELCEFLETLGVIKKDLLANAKYDIMLWHKLNDK